MKTEVYSWRVSARKKAELEAESRRGGTSLSQLLDDITTEWLVARARGGDEEAEQAAIRNRAAVAIGAVASGDRTRASRASEIVRQIIERKHRKESRASRRTD